MYDDCSMPLYFTLLVVCRRTWWHACLYTCYLNYNLINYVHNCLDYFGVVYHKYQTQLCIVDKYVRAINVRFLAENSTRKHDQWFSVCRASQNALRIMPYDYKAYQYRNNVITWCKSAHPTVWMYKRIPVFIGTAIALSGGRNLVRTKWD